MTQDLRQAILALTNAVQGDPIFERVRDNVLALMPAGPILESLWAGLPSPTAVMNAREGSNWEVRAFYPHEAQANRVHTILAKPMIDLELELKVWGQHEEQESQKAKLAREHALEKRLLTERDAFTLAEERVPDVLDAVMTELDDMAACSFSSGEDQQAAVEEAATKIMDKIKEAATKPVHAVVEAVEEEAGLEQAPV